MRENAKVCTLKLLTNNSNPNLNYNGLKLLKLIPTL